MEMQAHKAADVWSLHYGAYDPATMLKVGGSTQWSDVGSMDNALADNGLGRREGYSVHATSYSIIVVNSKLNRASTIEAPYLSDSGSDIDHESRLA